MLDGSGSESVIGCGVRAWVGWAVQVRDAHSECRASGHRGGRDNACREANRIAQ
jgi:hypothetical protein